MDSEVAVANWEIVVDRDVCMGSGMCFMYASNTFDLDDEAKSFVKDVEGDRIETIRTAIEACPTGALRLVEG
jgi:ferredoxin